MTVVLSQKTTSPLPAPRDVREAFAHPPGLLQPVEAVPAAAARVAPAVQHHALARAAAASAGMAPIELPSR